MLNLALEKNGFACLHFYLFEFLFWKRFGLLVFLEMILSVCDLVCVFFLEMILFVFGNDLFVWCYIPLQNILHLILIAVWFSTENDLICF